MKRKIKDEVKPSEPADTSLESVLNELVKILGDKSPNMPKYMAVLNWYISPSGNGSEQFKGLSEQFSASPKRLQGLSRYLIGLFREGSITYDEMFLVGEVAKGSPYKNHP